MIAGNEEDWGKYNNPKYQAVQLKQARLVQSGIDPEKSLSKFRVILLIDGFILVLIGAIYWLSV